MTASKCKKDKVRKREKSTDSLEPTGISDTCTADCKASVDSQRHKRPLKLEHKLQLWSSNMDITLMASTELFLVVPGEVTKPEDCVGHDL